MKGKKLFSFIAVDDNTPIQKLTFSEQLRVLVQRMTNESKEQLKADDAETAYQLQLKANLLEFLHKATEKVRQGEHHSVTVAVSSKFLPVLDDVLSSSSISTFYTYTVEKPEIEYDIEYFIEITLEVKSY